MDRSDGSPFIRPIRPPWIQDLRIWKFLPMKKTSVSVIASPYSGVAIWDGWVTAGLPRYARNDETFDRVRPAIVRIDTVSI